MSKHRLVILSGPSCVGKSPLDRALKRLYPDVRNKLQPLVLYNSRDPRQGEVNGVDYHFRTRDQIMEMQDDHRFVIMDVRGDLQVLDLLDLELLLKKGDVFYEGNPFTGKLLITHPVIQKVKKLSVFMSPLSKEEITYLLTPEFNIDLPDIISNIMRRKLLRRTRKQKGELSLKDLENIEKRAGSAYRELMQACHFQYVLPNHDGEDSEHWDAFYYLLGDARRVALAFIDLLEGKVPALAETWEETLLP
jgi:guanylate kinase